MEARKVEQLAEFHAGEKLGLTPEQVKTRAHNLKDLGDGVYEVVRSVQFKAGEVICVETPTTRAAAAVFQKPVEVAAKPTRKRRA